MSQTAQRISLAAAVDLSDRVVEALRPGCERICVAGSIRRRQRDIGDVEIVCMPRPANGLFPGQVSGHQLDPILARLQREQRIVAGRIDGPRAKQFVLVRSSVKLDLFIVTPETWGVQLAIRTGPAEFSRELVTPRSRGGRLQDDLVVHDGRVWDAWTQDKQGVVMTVGDALDTAEETQFLELCGGWIDPWNRRPLR